MASVQLFAEGEVPAWTAERVRRRLEEYGKQRTDITSIETRVLGQSRPYLEPVGEHIPLTDEHVVQWDAFGPYRPACWIIGALSTAGSVIFAYIMPRNAVYYATAAAWHAVNIPIICFLVFERARVCTVPLLARNFDVYYLCWQVLMSRSSAILYEMQYEITWWSVLFLVTASTANAAAAILALICNDAIHAEQRLKGLTFVVGLLYFGFRYILLRVRGPHESDMMTCDYVVCFSTHAINQEANAVLTAFCFKFFYSFYIKKRDYVLISFRSRLRVDTHLDDIVLPTRNPPPLHLVTGVTDIVKGVLGKRHRLVESAGPTDTRIVVTLDLTPTLEVPIRPHRAHKHRHSVFRTGAHGAIVPLVAERDVTGSCVISSSWLLGCGRSPFHQTTVNCLSILLCAVYILKDRLPDVVLVIASLIACAGFFAAVGVGALAQTGVLWQLANCFVFWFLMKNLFVLAAVGVHQAITTNLSTTRSICSATLAVYLVLFLAQFLCCEAYRVRTSRFRWLFGVPCVVLLGLFFASRLDDQREWRATMCLELCANPVVMQESAVGTLLAFFLRFWWSLWHGRRYALIKFGAVAREVAGEDGIESTSSTE